DGWSFGGCGGRWGGSVGAREEQRGQPCEEPQGNVSGASFDGTRGAGRGGAGGLGIGKRAHGGEAAVVRAAWKGEPPPSIRCASPRPSPAPSERPQRPLRPGRFLAWVARAVFDAAGADRPVRDDEALARA